MEIGYAIEESRETAHARCTYTLPSTIRLLRLDTTHNSSVLRGQGMGAFSRRYSEHTAKRSTLRKARATESLRHALRDLPWRKLSHVRRHTSGGDGCGAISRKIMRHDPRSAAARSAALKKNVEFCTENPAQTRSGLGEGASGERDSASSRKGV